jgi:hypothetical protein
VLLCLGGRRSKLNIDAKESHSLMNDEGEFLNFGSQLFWTRLYFNMILSTLNASSRFLGTFLVNIIFRPLSRQPS